MLRIAIHCYKYKDFNHGCKDGYILGKTSVSLPITTVYSLPPPPPPHMRPVPVKKDSRTRNDRAKLHELALDPIHSWSTAADSCPPCDFSNRPPNSISMTTGRKWLTWNRSIVWAWASTLVACNATPDGGLVKTDKSCLLHLLESGATHGRIDTRRNGSTSDYSSHCWYIFTSGWSSVSIRNTGIDQRRTSGFCRWQVSAAQHQVVRAWT